jgi:hypothetical protein
MTEKRMPVAERQQETMGTGPSLQVVVVENWPDTGHMPGRESGLTRSGESVKRKTTMIPEPKEKPAAKPWFW